MRLPSRASVALLLLITSCNLPKDSSGTLEHVRGGVLRVGVAENRPWTIRSDTTLTGSEVDIVRDLARELGATPTWRVGGESTLLEALEARQLDLVIGGLTTRSPWATRVAFTKPYEKGESPSHVIAMSAGENAFLVHVEDFLRERATAAAAK